MCDNLACVTCGPWYYRWLNKLFGYTPEARLQYRETHRTDEYAVYRADACLNDGNFIKPTIRYEHLPKAYETVYTVPKHVGENIKVPEGSTIKFY